MDIRDEIKNSIQFKPGIVTVTGTGSNVATEIDTGALGPD
jgi:hypothetical protein